MASGMKELNLEHGMPTVDTALRWLESELDAARKMRRPALKLIHGYGSSGRGGKIRTASANIPERGRRQDPPGDPGGGLLHFQRGDPPELYPVRRVCGMIGIWIGKTGA